MKIISHNEGVVIWHAAWDEIRPLHGAPFSQLVDFLQMRYGFIEVGSSAFAQAQGIQTPVLKHGFLQDAPNLGINALEFNADKLAVSTASTDLSDAVLDDIMGHLVDSLDFRLPTGNRLKHYRSAVTFDPEADLEAYLDSPWRIISNRLTSAKGGVEQFAPASLKFMQGGLTADIDRIYTLERRASAPQGTNWWFSSAPLPSDEHVDLVAEISKLAGKASKQLPKG